MLLPALYALLVGIGILLVVWTLGTVPPQAPEAVLRQRLEAYEGRPRGLEEIELAQPLADRLLRPFLDRFGSQLAAHTPERTMAGIRQRLERAGLRSLSPAAIVAAQAALAVVLAAIVAVISLFSQNVLVAILGIPLAVLAGTVLPLIWLDVVVRRRRAQIIRSLPDAMDMLTISVEAGLSFETAMANVADRLHNALGDEFEQVLLETRLGRQRYEALEAMGRRVGVEDLENFVQAVIQSEQLGVSIARILRLQAAELRRKRRQRVQEEAAKASLKMLIPMVGCIFPTLWIVLLGPSLVLLVHALR